MKIAKKKRPADRNQKAKSVLDDIIKLSEKPKAKKK